jgi:hypothetical protein
MSMSPHHLVEPTEDPVGAGAPAAPSRRRFVRNVGLGAAALGAAAVAGGALTEVASAQSASTEAPALSAPDVALVRWLQSLSLAAEDGLTTATQATFLSAGNKSTIQAFVRHHRDQAVALGALLQEDEAVTTPNSRLLTELDGQVSGAGNEEALLTALQAFEERLAATMLAGVGDAEAFWVAGAIASATAVVGQQAATLGAAADLPIDEWLPSFATTAGAYSQAAYPVS